jgi:ribosomal-protein-alanine N-acetyltransferase
MNLRHPTPADYLHIASWIPDAEACRLWAGPLVPFPFLAQELAELLALDRSVSYCLEEGEGVPLGFGQYWPRHDGSAHLLRIIVSPERRGEGVGQALCRQLIDRAFAAGSTAVTLNVYPENTSAVALYERVGFRRDESRPIRDSLFMRLPAAKAAARYTTTSTSSTDG